MVRVEQNENSKYFITQPTFSTRTDVIITSSGLMALCYGAIYETGSVSCRQTETKKQKIARIARELMYASWRMYNQKTVSIIEVIQIQKPRHRTHFYGKS